MEKSTFGWWAGRMGGEGDISFMLAQLGGVRGLLLK